MKTERIISLYRRAKRGDSEARLQVQNAYIHEQRLHLPKRLYDWSGLMGHDSVWYTEELFKDHYNKELHTAFEYAAVSYLEDEEKRMA